MDLAAKPAPKPAPEEMASLGAALDNIDLGLVFSEDKGGEAPKSTDQLMEISLDDLEIEEEAPAEPAAGREGSLIEKLPPVPLFSSLDRSALQELIEKVEVKTFSAGEIIIRQNEKGNSLYVLAEGEAQVFLEGPARVDLSRLEEGSFFGEISLLSNRPRTASVEAVGDATLLVVSRETINGLVKNHPGALKVLLRFFRDRLIHSLVHTHTLFSALPEPERGELVKKFCFVEAKSCSLLVKEGELADGLYIILSGDAEMRQSGQALSLLSSGDLFGEESLLTDEPSDITVETVSKCWLLKMKRETFREVIMTYGPLLQVISDIVERHKRKNKGDPVEQESIPLI
jgi:CRP-like cAMP-binding protein